MSLSRLGTGLVVLFTFSLVVGSVLGQPILLSYVETGSMAPTLESGDGFVAIPTQVDSSIETGSVIVFRAKKIQGGGLTTHRVVGETDRGYITRGDANPFTDQANVEPPVKRPQIVAKALKINGEVVVIPKIGTAIEGTQAGLTAMQRRLAGLLGTRAMLGVQGLGYGLFALAIVWYLIETWREGNRRERTRQVSRRTGMDVRLFIGVLTAILVLSTTAAMTVPAGSSEYDIISANFESEKPTVVPAGESKTRTYPVDNGGVVPVVAFLESEGERVAISPNEVYVAPNSMNNATVTLHAPPRTGHYRGFVVESRYLALLPMSTIRKLHALHHWAPVLVINGLVAVPFYVLGVQFAGSGRIRSLDRSGGSTISNLTGRFT